MMKNPERYKHVHRCEVCGYPFLSARRTAKTCSDRCRQRKSRAGRAARGLSERVTIQQLEMLLLTHGGQMTMF
jgi:hypothetical protein